jgi:hypothetical protein
LAATATDAEWAETSAQKRVLISTGEDLDELYYDLGGETPIRVLATARFDGADPPTAFVLTCGKGRVFHCPLGHDIEARSVVTAPAAICVLFTHE